MNFLELAQTRYATKRYNPNKKIPLEAIAQLKEILRLSPSSINCQPWRFIFVEDIAMKAQLAKVSQHNEQKINDANLLIVFTVIDDLSAYQHYVDNEMETRLADWYNDLRKVMTDEQIKTWLTHQVYISLGFCLSACISMGLDSTPMEGIEHEHYHEILRLGDYRPTFAVAVGYRADDDANDPKRTPKSRRALMDVVTTI